MSIIMFIYLQICETRRSFDWAQQSRSYKDNAVYPITQWGMPLFYRAYYTLSLPNQICFIILTTLDKAIN